MSVIPVESCTVSVIDGRVQAFRGRHYTNYGVSGDFGFFGRPTNRAKVTVDSDTSYAGLFPFLSVERPGDWPNRWCVVRPLPRLWIDRPSYNARTSVYTVLSIYELSSKVASLKSTPTNSVYRDFSFSAAQRVIAPARKFRKTIPLKVAEKNK